VRGELFESPPSKIVRSEAGELAGCGPFDAGRVGMQAKGSSMPRRVLRWVGLFTLAAAALVASARPSFAQFQHTAKAGPVSLQLWIPDGVTNLKGVLAFSSVGLDNAWPTSDDFRALAKRLETGVVKVTGADPFGSYANRCSSGAFKYVLDALTDLGKMSNHPELANAPIVGSGHSHGGDYWNYFNACYPERVALIFCKSSGGVQYTGAALKTPMVWEVGMEDLHDHIGAGHFRAQMLAHRNKGSQLSLVLGPGETHGQLGAGPRQMVIDLMEALFKLRVPAGADGTKGPIVLNEIHESNGTYWLGDNYTKEIAAYPTSPDRMALEKTSFLPSEELAKKWAMVGDKLPTMYKVDTGGVCTGCYPHPGDEPPGAPSTTPTDGGTTPPATEDAATPPAADAGATEEPDAAPPASSPDAAPQGGNPPPKHVDAAPKPPTSDPGDDEPTTPPATGTSSGCALAGAALHDGSVAGGPLLLLALVLLRRRARRSAR
jgi:hypothetical protein